MKVVIADDEEKICQLIYKLVDWEEMDMQVEAVVHNGIEALEAIREYQPDIIITDIRMPGYDGLELIVRAKEISPNLEFIIISGYRQFEYAQRALKYGVRDYLLKPISQKELNSALNRLRLFYLERTEQLSREEQFRISMKNNIDRIRTSFFYDVLFRKKLEKEELSPEVLNEKYHYHFEEGCFQIILIKLDGIYEANSKNLKYAEEKMIQLMRENLTNECFDLESFVENGICHTVLNYAPDHKKTIRKNLKTALDDMLLQKELFEYLEVTFGVGTVGESIEKLFESFKSAIWAIEERLIQGTNKIIDGRSGSSNELANSELFYEFNKKMTGALERLDVQEAAAAIRLLQKGLNERKSTNGHEILQMAREAMNLYLFTVRSSKFPAGNPNPNLDNLFENFNQELNQYGSADKIFNYLIKEVTSSFEIIIEEMKEADSRPIRIAKQYIQEHFNETLTLESVSGEAGFNTTYFSSMFKKETGVTFSEYLQEVRMNRAKELLKETNRNIQDICEEVGYNDLKSFTKIFAKHTGLKPNEYRKLYA